MGSIHEKNRGRKSRDTAPLKDSTWAPGDQAKMVS